MSFFSSVYVKMVLFSKINQKLIISVSDFHCHTKGYQYQELANSDRYLLILHKTYPEEFMKLLS